MCINEEQPEPCYEKTQPWSHVIKKHNPELEPYLRKQRGLELEPFHFYKISAALLSTTTSIRKQTNAYYTRKIQTATRADVYRLAMLLL